MKRLKILAVLVPVMLFSQQKNLTVSGTTSSDNVRIEQFSPVSGLKIYTDNEIPVADFKENAFKVSVPLSKCTYFRINRNFIYGCPGDHIEMKINNDEAAKTVFSGNHSAYNTYLGNLPYPKAGSFLLGGTYVKKTLAETAQTIDSLKTQREAELSALKDISAEIRTLEKARIKADYMNTYLNLPFYFGYVNKISEADLKAMQPQFDGYLQNIKVDDAFINQKYLALHVYPVLMSYILEKGNPKNPEYAKLQDWENARQLSQNLQHLKDKKEIMQNYQSQISTIKSPEYQAVLKEVAQKLSAYGNGDTAKEIIATDADGKPQKLSQFKGKTIFLDLWATWCGPCLKEMPFYDQLKQQYADHPEVVFISLSIDDNVQAWKNHLKKRNASGNQWIIKRSDLNAYNVTSVPRTIFIDKDFVIHNFHGPEPSNKETTNIINTLIKK